MAQEVSHMGDHLIWNNFREGNAEAFGLLYYRYFKILFYGSYKICNDRETIRDCIHDLFAELWNNRLRLLIPQSVKAYLICSVQRKLLRRLKRNRRSNCHLYITDTMLVQSVEEKIILEQLRREREKRVIRAMETLSQRQRQALSLRFYGNLSYPEIAGEMSISKNAVYNLVSKAISNMQLGMAGSLKKYDPLIINQPLTRDD
ncbi:MAG: sigma-70 family RNA polymerase sigma factor [Flavitalea sp.]